MDEKALIKENEGFSKTVYIDSRGYPTIGYGHLLREGTAIPSDALEIIFEADYANAVDGYVSLGLDLDPVRRSVIVDMIFNLGVAGVKKFKLMLHYLRDKNWIRAAYELMDSEYAKQVPERAKRNRDRLLRG